MNDKRVAIIGGGPAGIMAAIQLKRFGLNSLLFEKKRLGGLLWNANLVENYPGFPGGIPGPALVERFVKQFDTHNLSALKESVITIDHDGVNFLLNTETHEYAAQTVVLATGTRPNRLPDELIPPDVRELVCYEVAEIADMTHQQIAIIGAGDAAFDYALNLAERGNRVMIFNRGNEIKALGPLVKRAAASPHISYHANASLTAVQREGDQLQLEVVDGSQKSAYKMDILLGAIGRSPVQPAFTRRATADLPALEKSGKFIRIGDVCNGRFRQTAIAVGDGLRAAMEIYQFLKEE